MTNTISSRLSAQDAAFLYWERANAPLHIGSLGVYEGHIPFERFVTQLDSRMPLLPRYRQRVVAVPFNLAQPTWEDDPDFRIQNHVHHLSLPSPGSDEQLTELAAELFARPLDRAKPLWEMYIIDGLEGGRSGIVSKVHHCLVDGVSGIGLLMVILDLSPDPAPAPDPQPWNPGPLPSPASQLTGAFWVGMAQQREMLREFQESLIDPRSSLQRGQNMMQAVNLASPRWGQSMPRAPFAAQLSPKRRVAFSEISFVEVREIRTSLGGTVDDVVLAILAGALRRYLGGDDAGPEPRVAIPVNIRLEGEEGALGNRLSCMITSLPIAEADPAARLQTVCERLDLLKRENQAGGLELLSRLAGQAPAPIQALAEGAPVTNSLVDMVCTNVPGPMIPLYSVGHLMLAHYPLVPLSFNMGLGLSVTGYNQQLYFSLMVDPNALPDVERLNECLDESFLELRRAAGVAAFDLPEFRGQAAGNGGTAVSPEAPVEEQKKRRAKKKPPSPRARRR